MQYNLVPLFLSNTTTKTCFKSLSQVEAIVVSVEIYIQLLRHINYNYRYLQLYLLGSRLVHDYCYEDGRDLSTTFLISTKFIHPLFETIIIINYCHLQLSLLGPALYCYGRDPGLISTTFLIKPKFGLEFRAD